MSITINGTGSISGLSATGISAQPKFPGNILQVVNATYSTVVTSSSATFADTGLSASITPTSASSKILVMIMQEGCGKGAVNTTLQLRLLRGATQLIVFNSGGGYTATALEQRIGVTGCTYLDSPATTSSVTYKTQFRSQDNIANVVVQDASSTSTITLMEVAA